MADLLWPGLLSSVDGSYCEHGREVFDEEVEPAPLEKEGGPKKTVSEHCERRGKPSLNRGTLCTYSRCCPAFHRQVPKRVARPASSVNIKSMLMGRGDAGRVKKRKKEVGVAWAGPLQLLIGLILCRKVSR